MTTQSASELRAILIVNILVWMVTLFGIVLSGAIMSRMPAHLAILLAIGMACASTPFALVFGWIMLKYQQD